MRAGGRSPDRVQLAVVEAGREVECMKIPDAGHDDEQSELRFSYER